MIDGADDRDATRPGFPASIARAARESLDFGHADTAPALAQGRGPGNEHVSHFQMHKPDPRHDDHGCIDHVARKQLADIYERLHGGDGGEGLAQKRARDDERIGLLEKAVHELSAEFRAEAKELRKGFGAISQAIADRGAPGWYWFCGALAFVAIVVACGVHIYKTAGEMRAREAQRIEARP